MKKLFTFLLAAVAAAMLSVGSLSAQPGTYYENYFLNQNFDGVEAAPAGYSFGSGGSAYLGRGGSGWSFGIPAQGFVRINGSGPGARGGELRFPSTATSPCKDSTVWVIEFDWTAAAVALNNGGGATAVALLGPNSANLRTQATFWAALIFEFYVYQAEGNIHLANLDPIGKNPYTGEPFRADGLPTLVGNLTDGDNNSNFGRRSDNPLSADTLNATTKTNVAFGAGRQYHIFAEINFATQQIQQFIMYENANPANGDTLLNLPFLAPTAAGLSSSVAPNDRKVMEFDRLSSWATRPGGGNSNCDHNYDNLKTYTWKESVGIDTVFVNYVDWDGNTIKPTKELLRQQVTSPVSITPDDKQNFIVGDKYYFYDIDRTHAANANNPQAGADQESITVGLNEEAGANNSLTVVFKTSTPVSGDYVWNGANNFKWNYIDNNFSIAGGAPIEYQPGNKAIFSNADVVNKEIEVTGLTELGDADIIISAPDYIFTGAGRIEGNGTIQVSKGTTLGVDNRMAGGAIISTPEEITIRHERAAAKFVTAEPALTLNRELGATLNIPISNTNGAAGNVLNINLMANNETASAISGFSTININQMVRASLRSATWGSGWGGTLPDSVFINITNMVDDGIPVPNGFGVTGTVLQRARVKLGDGVRLVRQYNEDNSNNQVQYIGELSSDGGGRLEGGFVDGRYFRYEIGGLNTDAVFTGTIGAYTKSYAAATDSTAEATAYAANGFGITKAGTGSWTVNADFNFPASGRGSQVNVSGGKFIINGNIDFPNYSKEGSKMTISGGSLMDVNGKIAFASDSAVHAITVSGGSTLQLHDSVKIAAVNQLTLSVDSTSTLKTGNNVIGAYNVLVNGTVEGGGEYANVFSMTDPAHALLKLKLNSFNEGDYEKVVAAGDITVDGMLDLTITTAPDKNMAIYPLQAAGNVNITTVKVRVNGADIIIGDFIYEDEDNNNAITVAYEMIEVPEGVPGVYFFDQTYAALGYKKNPNSVNENNYGKTVLSIEYFNVLGQKVSEYAEGISVRKITYTDGSVQTVKTLKQVK